MNLIQLTENVFYIESGTNIGVINDKNGVILIDTGLDDETAANILQILEKNHLYPKAIINTHSHGDHCGGNAYIQKHASVKIYASEIEAGIIQTPILEPLYFFSGAWPIDDLMVRILNAPPSHVDYIIEKDENYLGFEDIELKIIKLPGHSPNQIGIAVEGVLFCADAVFGERVLKRHPIPYHIDIGQLKNTLDYLKKSRFNMYVPSHGEHTNSIKSIVEMNSEVIENIERFIKEDTLKKKTIEELVKDVCDFCGIKIKNARSYFVLKTSVMAYLTALYRERVLNIEVNDNTIYWINAIK